MSGAYRAPRLPAVEQLVDAHGLTATEAEVALCLAQGMNIRNIASVRDVSEHTVRTQVKRAMARLGVHTQVGLVAAILGLAR